MTLGEFRRSLGLTQKEAADRCGMSHVQWYRMESGERRGTPLSWAKIRMAFGLTPNQIWEMTQRRESPKRKLKRRGKDV